MHLERDEFEVTFDERRPFFVEGSQLLGGAGGNNGRIYLQYKKLDAVLKILNGERNLDIIGARQKYDEYEISRPAGQ